MFAIMVSFIVGAFLGGAASDAVYFLSQSQTSDAADSCLRWGLAFLILFILGPLANIDEAWHHIGSQYLAMLHFHAPAVLASILLVICGVRLNYLAAHSPVASVRT